jgi:hypothetical protein
MGVTTGVAEILTGLMAVGIYRQAYTFRIWKGVVFQEIPPDFLGHFRTTL